MVVVVRRFDGKFGAIERVTHGRAGATPRRYLLNLYFKGEKFAGTRILLYWLTIMACAFGRNA